MSCVSINRISFTYNSIYQRAISQKKERKNSFLLPKNCLISFFTFLQRLFMNERVRFLRFSSLR